MKCIYTALLVILMTVSASAQEWYENGTLHSSTVKEWKQAEYENKIATSADWIISGSKSIKTKVMNSGNLNNLKPFCKELVVCIDGATKDHTNWDASATTEVAATCMTLMGWLK